MSEFKHMWTAEELAEKARNLKPGETINLGGDQSLIVVYDENILEEYSLAIYRGDTPIHVGSTVYWFSPYIGWVESEVARFEDGYPVLGEEATPITQSQSEIEITGPLYSDEECTQELGSYTIRGCVQENVYRQKIGFNGTLSVEWGQAYGDYAYIDKADISDGGLGDLSGISGTALSQGSLKKPLLLVNFDFSKGKLDIAGVGGTDVWQQITSFEGGVVGYKISSSPN